MKGKHSSKEYQSLFVWRKKLELFRARQSIGVEVTSGLSSSDHVRLVELTVMFKEASFYDATGEQRPDENFRTRTPAEIAQAYDDVLSGIDGELKRRALPIEYSEKLRSLRQAVITAKRDPLAA